MNKKIKIILVLAVLSALLTSCTITREYGTKKEDESQGTNEISSGETIADETSVSEASEGNISSDNSKKEINEDSLEKNEEKDSSNNKNSEKKENDEKDNSKQNENAKNSNEDLVVKIAINKSNGKMGVAEVDRKKLVEYIEASNDNGIHEFYYERAKDELWFTLDNRNKNQPDTAKQEISLENQFKGTSFEIKSKVELDGRNIYTILSTKSKKTVKISDVRMVGDYLVGKLLDSNSLSVFDDRLNVKFASGFLDFYYLGDNYYAGSRDESAYTDESINGMLFEADGCRDYRVDAIYDGEELTPFKYFVIRYLGDDIFYLFDGKEFYFMNLKTGERVYKHVNINFNIYDFKVYNDLIIGNAGDIQVLITKNNYSITKPTWSYDNAVEIFTGIMPDGIVINKYPIFVFKDKVMSEKANKKIYDIFLKGFEGKDDSEIKKSDDGINIAFADDMINGYHKDENGRKICVARNDDISFEITNKKSYINLKSRLYRDGLISAHTSMYFKYYVWDIYTGEIIKINDLFKESKNAEDFILLELANQAMKADEGQQISEINKLTTSKNLLREAREVFLEDSVGKFNFYLDKNSLKIVYNPYEIASYAVGVIEYEIPYEKLEPYFKESVKSSLGLKQEQTEK